jgi:hypothetical protein
VGDPDKDGRLIVKRNLVNFMRDCERDKGGGGKQMEGVLA